ncbi:hypothetical protein DFJ67_0111 [Asanoa ferruginea]|uniref:Uncharacterized protein n=1 Tax=Asanoa ferruginea TaxID=53367 RepID=A0A3D9Z9X4_9ACTN|nr:hypothetical protein DFJ67_0111 [Asanoa ferruginea]
MPLLMRIQGGGSVEPKIKLTDMPPQIAALGS